MFSEDELYKKAIQKWGIYPQLIQFYGEIGELMAVICDFDRQRATKEQVIDEIADTLIMINQIKVLSNISDNEVQARKEFKLIRLKERLEL